MKTGGQAKRQTGGRNGSAPLSAAEESALSQRVRAGDRKALDRLLQANMRFVVSMAQRYKGRGVDVADLIGEGNIALLRAAERFDGAHGCRFTSYAAPFVRKSMEGVIDAAGVYMAPRGDGVQDAMRRRTTLSADAPLGGKANVCLLNVLADGGAEVADTAAERASSVGRLRALMACLDDRERRVVTLFYGLGVERRTFAEIGESMGLRRERVRQIRDKALRKLSKLKRANAVR